MHKQLMFRCVYEHSKKDKVIVLFTTIEVYWAENQTIDFLICVFDTYIKIV